MKKRVALYMRCSTSEQTTASQKTALNNYCKIHQFRIIKIYEDSGISGTVNDRPALDQLKYDCKMNKWDAVCVFKFDRMARSTQHLISILSLLHKNDKDIISITEAIDTTTSVGRMVYQFLGSIAEFEASAIRERIVAGIRNAQANNVHCGRKKSGFDIKQALELRKEGYSYMQISKRLNDNISHMSIYRRIKELEA